jgi:acetyl-CoA C-acetyltransferase
MKRVTFARSTYAGVGDHDTRATAPRYNRSVGSRVAVVGAGWSGFAATTPGVSYKELMFAAASRAYVDAGLDPRTDVDSFVACSEDLEEGTSIFDEYVPDQLGAVQRPVHTIAADGLFGLVTGVMLIASGVARRVAVEAHSKASDVMSLGRIDRFALDPVLNRPLGCNPVALAGLEMRAYLDASGRTVEDCAAVAERNRRHAASSPRARGGRPDPRPLADPLTADQAAEPADGCVVVVLAEADAAGPGAVTVDGIGWSQDAPSLESRVWDRAVYAECAVADAYRRAGIGPGDVDLAEVDDRFAYKQLQHLDAAGLAGLDPERVNASGGALGEGDLREANGLARALACVERLWAGEAATALALGWRGLPSSSGAALVMRRG